MGADWARFSVRLFLHSRTEMLCIFFTFFGINKISGISSANLTLPFGGNAGVVTEGSPFQDGLQANRSVFPLHRIFCLLKYFIALNSPTWLDVWGAAQIAKFGVGRQICVLLVERAVRFHFFIAGCPKHGATTTRCWLASVIFGQDRVFLAFSADCRSRGELNNS